MQQNEGVVSWFVITALLNFINICDNVVIIIIVVFVVLTSAIVVVICVTAMMLVKLITIFRRIIMVISLNLCFTNARIVTCRLYSTIRALPHWHVDST